MVIEVSHESPISILDKSLEYNDYAYALVHLFETHPDYYKFFKNLVDENNNPRPDYYIWNEETKQWDLINE